MAKTNNEVVGLTCEDCKSRNYVTTRNKVNMQQKDPSNTKLKIRKFCNACHKHTVHKETTSLK